MTVINTNIRAVMVQNALQLNDRTLTSAMQQLSSGKRINSAKDDAAGLAISSRMTQEIQALDQASRNANDAISLIQTAEGSTAEITSMLQRMRELAIQSVNDTNSDAQRGLLDGEFQQLKQQIDQVAKNTQWNGFPILDGSCGTSGVLSFQVGSGSGQTLDITIGDFGPSGGIVDTVTSDFADTTPTITIASADAATAALGFLDSAMTALNVKRANMGAVMNRLQHVIDNLINVSSNTIQSRSTIEDADYAKVSSSLARAQIIQQAATAVLAQANTSQQTVLKLLQ
jgi:flagellin